MGTQGSMLFISMIKYNIVNTKLKQPSILKHKLSILFLMAFVIPYNGVNLPMFSIQVQKRSFLKNEDQIHNILEIRVRNKPFPKHQRKRFENENTCISPTFQQAVGRHLKPSLPVVAMATLNHYIFSGFIKQYSTIKNTKAFYYTHIHL